MFHPHPNPLRPDPPDPDPPVLDFRYLDPPGRPPPNWHSLGAPHLHQEQDIRASIFLNSNVIEELAGPYITEAMK